VGQTNFQWRRLGIEGHPYVDTLKSNEHSMLIDMTKSLVKPTNIITYFEIAQ